MLVRTKKYLISALIVIGIMGGFLLYYFFNPAQNTFFVPCPFHYTTGFYCPGCGSQRALHQLFHLNISGAFKYNPLLVLSLPLVIYALAITLHNFYFDTQYRISFFYKNWFVWGFFGLVLVFWIVRNLPYYPFNLLAPTS